MKVKINRAADAETETEGEDSLPGDETPEIQEPVVDKKSERERELELELAEKRGELKALKSNAGAGSGQMTIEQTKQLVFGDINNLSDEDFQKKYRTSKHAASMTVMDADNRQTKAEARQLHAEAEASVELSSKYADFGKFKSQIRENMADLSEEARQNPERLSKFMERQYLALSRDSERPAPQKKSDDRRRVVADFEKPQRGAADEPREVESDEIKDEIPADSDISNQKLAHLMGVRSEKERKDLAGKDLIYVDMELGEGWRFGDPRQGFQKRQKVA